MSKSVLVAVGMAVALVSSVSALAQNAPALSRLDGKTALRSIVSHSECASHEWPYRRGTARYSYIEGVTVAFARAICHPERADVQVVSAPVDPSSIKTDALAVYQADFKRLGLLNASSGPDTLRHSYTLLIGLGMMESSGKYCEGRDVSQCFSTSESAEAGLFQTSYGTRHYSPVLSEMFQSYSADQSRCLSDVFQKPVCSITKSNNAKCPAATSATAGTGPGADWQNLTKSCPAFATEYGVVVLRTHGGTTGEFNPIRKHQVELHPQCDGMLKEAQTYIEAHREVCSEL